MDNNNFVLKLVKVDDIYINQQEKDFIIMAIQNDQKSFMLRGMYITCSSVMMILPRYGENNIPPRPKIEYDRKGYMPNEINTTTDGKEWVFGKNNETVYLPIKNVNELEQWDKLYNNYKKLT